MKRQEIREKLKQLSSACLEWKGVPQRAAVFLFAKHSQALTHAHLFTPVLGLSGVASERLAALDLEGDFDPDDFDQQLQAAFDDQFYEEDEDLKDGKPRKPKFDDDLDDFDYGEGEMDGDGDGDVDAAVAAALEGDGADGADGKKKKKNKNKGDGDAGDMGADEADAEAAAMTMDAEGGLSNRQVSAVVLRLSEVLLGWPAAMWESVCLTIVPCASSPHSPPPSSRGKSC